MAKKKNKSKANMQKRTEKSAEHDTTVTPALTIKPVLLKVCRLCETKDGPFLNIFESDKATARKIDDLMPFGISENDGLPHKICFRCSAKVEELHEFVQKCVKTQENLLEATGRKDLINTKTKTREQWEEKLNQSNMSNDDICDALIKKAMEAIKDMPLHQSVITEEEKPLSNLRIPEPINNDIKSEPTVDPPLNLKPVKLSIEKCDQRVTRSARSGDSKVSKEIPTEEIKPVSKPRNETKKSAKKPQVKEEPEIKPQTETTAEIKPEEPPKEKETAPFNIMDHVSIIKVNQVGVLFQCKLCNRNFLKKEIVESHFCARNGAPKADIAKNLPPPEPPKVTNTVKYIKMDNDKRITSNTISKESKEPPETETKDVVEQTKPKAKPKIGPASKVKKKQTESPPETQPSEPTPTPEKPTINFPALPCLNVRYKLMPGPNNSFVLVEEGTSQKPENEESSDIQKSNRKRKNDKVSTDTKGVEVIDVDEPPPVLPSQQKPYPVGLFQTVAHHAGMFVPDTKTEASTFTTPAMKKQSYTVHQTDNPSKLVISTKPQVSTEEVPKKKSKKTRPEVTENVSKEPFSVTLEDAAPPKDAGFFTFINVDPLLQPSYVLPTDNIIQESQISTSTPVVKTGSEGKEKDKDKYSCNMCSEKFSREKKLLAHLQSHYNKLDEEDLMREEKTNKRRRK